MQIQNDLTRIQQFLELKKAAEKRLATATSAKGATDPKALFFDTLRMARERKSGSVQAQAAAPKAAPAAKDGLSTVYSLNQALGKTFSSSPARETIVSRRHLGAFFDAVA
ncbi:MAG: hypothetical protein A2268_13100 [Candidatus Raymondbacteria bacterium RifOxyA12_full_50_37]|uniref:Uncharacterized protein n=1 Tax=Candidatus Raymondbacteria bacterium RIFOXYD12_FULL_49_13 TaxID=1817890 RepID=A0A1F7EZT9_UNCRA|nr:MAG: hypothetical protein A2268_13100 [Candidatus Raymondbacteria bacterium RifOxyA12_full_50_37]OGJ93000.1 MAG: hypothetical protein A2248_18235 [Candidatus Raymondbacteria bacterium RIFOXYA2_FULL_49_16]OGJ93608.1 MAG: hypothetical protein A2350_19190 [Candidatus Raymondbacteria bacterium RifOxyB12_full_50_8]OGJ99913.1 MAG: hypothetical protein A2519_00215 [Candidatus Raymondbacteria bacterium RIFOXYD12_FULL_49_13]OGK01577.1 MAG: hypothetical protein A2487_15665 [Candidatus Raymondbacteria 